jgi:hypothetical protein
MHMNFSYISTNIIKFVLKNFRKVATKSGDGRVGLRRQIKVLVRKGVGSNPTLHNTIFLFFLFVSFLTAKCQSKSPTLSP